jgi:hypothetical protein
VEALYRNGLLLVTMPKAESARPRRIKVDLGTDASERGEQKRLR